MSYKVSVSEITENGMTVEVYNQTVQNLKLAEVIKAVNKPERKKRSTKEEAQK